MRGEDRSKEEIKVRGGVGKKRGDGRGEEGGDEMRWRSGEKRGAIGERVKETRATFSLLFCVW